MRVVKIRKSYTNGVKEHHLVVSDTNYFQAVEDIDYLVQDWCDEEPSGHNSGYSYEWEHITDEGEIKKGIEARLKRVNNDISYLETEKDELLNKILEYIE